MQFGNAIFYFPETRKYPLVEIQTRETRHPGRDGDYSDTLTRYVLSLRPE